MAKDRRTTINATLSFAEVKDDKLVLRSWRGEERIAFQLTLDDFTLLSLIRTACEHAATRRTNHLERARIMANQVGQAAELLKKDLGA